MAIHPILQMRPRRIEGQGVFEPTFSLSVLNHARRPFVSIFLFSRTEVPEMELCTNINFEPRPEEPITYAKFSFLGFAMKAVNDGVAKTLVI